MRLVGSVSSRLLLGACVLVVACADSRDPQVVSLPSAASVRTVPVTLEGLNEYFRRAAPNTELTLAREQYVRDNKDSFQLEFQHEVECRGLVCRTLLTTKTEEAARKIERVKRPKDVDSFVAAKRVDLGDVQVTIFSSQPGSKLGEILARGANSDPAPR